MKPPRRSLPGLVRLDETFLVPELEPEAPDTTDPPGPDDAALAAPRAPSAFETTGAEPALADPPPPVAWEPPDEEPDGLAGDGTEGLGTGGGETEGTETEGTLTGGVGTEGTGTEGVETDGTETPGAASRARPKAWALGRAATAKPPSEVSESATAVAAPRARRPKSHRG